MALDVTVGRVKNPSFRAMLFDISQKSQPGCVSAAYKASVAQNRAEMVQGDGVMRHMGNKGANITFVDGHVTLMSFDAIPYNRLNSASNNQGMFWCSNN